MGKALVEEFCRANTLDPGFVIRCQREFRRDVVPLFDEIEALRQENADLKSRLSRSKKTEEVQA